MTSKQLTSTKHPVRPRKKAAVLRRPRGGTPKSAAVSVYQKRIAELESTLEIYRGKFSFLDSSVEQLRRKQTEWSEIFENTPAAYVIHDAAGYVQQMNRAAEMLFGIGREHRTPPCLAQFLSKGQLLLWLEHIRGCAGGGSVRRVDLQIRSRRGQPRRVELVTWSRPVPFRHRGTRFYTLLFPADQRQSSENALANALQDYHRLIDTIEGIVWEADPDYTVTFVSQYAERLLGFSVTEWTRPGFWANRIYVEDRERVLTELNQAMTKGKELRLEYRVTASDRRLVWLHDSIRVVERKGRPKLLGVAIDITEQRNAAQQLRQAHDLLEQRVEERTTELRRAVADLEAFSYSLSHDMRAPIRAMQGYVVLLGDLLRKDLTPNAADFLERIRHGAERLDMLVQDVLKYSRLGRPPVELKPIALEPLVSGILHDYPALTPPQAQVEVVSPLPPVYGHEAFVGQALSNLLTNAVKFVPKGKQPQVRLWAEQASKRPGDRGHWVRIWVEDNGLGIAPEDQTRIFRMFERVYPAEQYEGTGMGLAIVQKAMQQLGGRVGVESSPGQGSRFWIELPRA